jgi:hypothetical protein
MKMLLTFGFCFSNLTACSVNSECEVEMAVEKIKRHSTKYWSNPTELIKAVGRTIRFEVHKLINSVWNEEELPEQWKCLFIVPIYKKYDKRDHSNFWGILLLSTTCKILFNIQLSRLNPYTGEIIVDLQCGFWCNRSTTNHILYATFMNTWEKMGIKWGSAFATYRLQGSLWFS